MAVVEPTVYDTILVPTDGSEPAAAGIEHAVAIADAFYATIHVLSVLEQGPWGTPGRDRIRTDLEGEAEDAVEAVRAAASRADVPVEATIEPGVPHERILEAVRDGHIDAVVMATHGRTGAERVLIGSVTERVVRSSPVPVVTVPASA